MQNTIPQLNLKSKKTLKDPFYPNVQANLNQRSQLNFEASKIKPKPS